MEKRTPHCKLAVVKAMVAAGKVRTTISALAGGAALGFGFEEIAGVVAALTPGDFYKEYDHARRSPRLAGRLPAGDSGR
jgi:motility quorum-sensing regulator/GCU-specific mRNA interferase toxin